jgi:hypothetical protein
MSWKEVAKMSKQLVQKELYDENDLPFKTCSDCKNKLNGDYKIFKSYSRLNPNEKHRLIFGMAICDNCMETYFDEVSESTTKKLEELAEKHPKFDVTAINISFLYGLSDSREPKCIITNKTADQLNEYQVSAICHNEKQITEMIILGDEGLKAYENCISEETQGYIDDFINRIIDFPPELELLIKNEHFVLV